MSGKFVTSSFSRCFAIALLSIVFHYTGIAQATVQPFLLKQLEHGQEAGMVVIFKQQAKFPKDILPTTKASKGRMVFDKLQHTAKFSQAAVQSFILESNHTFRSFCIVNCLYTKGDLQFTRQLAAMPEVQLILADVSMQMEQPIQTDAVISRGGELPYGLIMIRANEVWELGIKGQGVVVSGQDTGYDWQHPALINSYLGWNGSIADHNYHWHDAIHEIDLNSQDSIILPENNPCGLNSPFPCDDNSHGTHTMGTMVGDDGADHQIGVAPAARWIGVRNMERGWGKLSTYLESFNWLLAPTDLNDQNPDPSRAPEVINNSWFCSDKEGCSLETNIFFEQVIDNLRNAGIFVVASAGNSGPGCNTIAFAPALLDNAFTIGATNEIDSIASYSSRGLVAADGSFRMKPDVCAPGSAVLSSVPGGNYAHFWGTSMAGPHAVGLVALIISANPGLAGNIEVIEDIIRTSAIPKMDTIGCDGVSGLTVPNASYGFGRIDAYQAVQLALNFKTNETLTKGNVKVFPQPFNQSVWFEIPGSENIREIAIYDALGQEIYRTGVIQSFSNRIEIPLNGLSSGLYFYRIETEVARYSGKLIKTE